MTDLNKRYFLKGLGRCLGRAVSIYHAEYARANEEIEKAGFFDSYESSCALTLAYPDEMILDAARRAGIQTENRETIDICRELFEQGEL